MRVVAGEFRGFRLTAPKGLATRPTTDRTRESLFNILGNRLDFKNLRVLDLFAGTGALGIESLSRGASFCKFIDNSASAIAAIKTNVEAVGVSEKTIVEKRDALKLPGRREEHSFDLVFADPPYSKGMGEKTANTLVTGNWIASGGLFVLEEHSRSFPKSLNGLELADVRKFGDTAIGVFIFEP